MESLPMSIARSNKVGGVYQAYADFEHGYDMTSRALGIGGKLSAHDLNFVVAKEGQVFPAGTFDHNGHYNNHYDIDTTQPNGYQSANGQRGRPNGPDVPFNREEMDPPAYRRKTKASPF